MLETMVSSLSHAYSLNSDFEMLSEECRGLIVLLRVHTVTILRNVMNTVYTFRLICSSYCMNVKNGNDFDFEDLEEYWLQ